MSDSWQPISTAPKDGTRILLGGYYRPFSAYSGGDWTEEIFTWSTLQSCGEKNYNWYSGFQTLEHWNVDWIMWHPLPSPPSK